jgi:hypothetical protein
MCVVGFPAFPPTERGPEVTNGCPICSGIGRILAFGVCRDPIAVQCPECAGLAIKPASADDEMRAYSVREITELLLRPALPPASTEVLPEASSH